MSPRLRPSVLLVMVGVLVAAPTPGPAQETPGPAGWLQAAGFYHRVTDDFGDWKGFGLNLVAPAGRRDIWYAEVMLREAFNDQGAYASLGNRHAFGEWFTLVSVGGGTGEFIHPDLRADFTLGKAWLPRRTLVTMAGITYVNAKLGFEDVAAFGSLALYFPGVVVEAGGRANWSYPGAVETGRGFGAITVGRERRRYVILRGSAGREGYQLTGVPATQRRFRSYEISLAWREWLGGRVGFFLQGEWYDNPFYTRTGATVGVFRHW